MRMRVGYLLFLMIYAGLTQAQYAGNQVFLASQLDNSAKTASLGGNTIATPLHLASTYYNPALLSQDLHGKMQFSFSPIFAGISNSSLSYGHHIDKVGTLSAHLQYVNYGEFQSRDEFGNDQGKFYANDYILSFGIGREMDSLFSYGLNLKYAGSNIESYKSSAILADFGVNFHKKSAGFMASMTVQNIGYQFKAFGLDMKEALPTQVSLAFSKKASKAPFRLNLIINDLQKWDIAIRDPRLKPTVDPITQEVIPVPEPKFADILMRHIVAGVEFIPTKNFHIDFAFNYRRRKELQLTAKPGMVGFSVGGGLKISKFHLSYGRSVYHRAGATNHISLSSSLNYWMKKS